MQTGTEVLINLGNALGGSLIPVLGVLVVIAARQLVTFVVVAPLYRPRRHEFTARHMLPAVALGVALALMNLTFYESIARVGLGTAATIEYVGPFAIAVVASRRVLDLACAVAVIAGIILLTLTDVRIDLLGILFGLGAAVMWVAYILLTRRVALGLNGFGGITIASATASVLLVPVAVVVVHWSALTWAVCGLLLVAAICSSAVPYTLDTFVLRRIPPRLYSVMTSFGPVIAAVFGAIVLHEALGALQVVGIVVVCAAAAFAISTQRER